MGHPCRIYNILAVDAPVIYIGPKPSHVTEIVHWLGDECPSIRVAHDEAKVFVIFRQQNGRCQVVMLGDPA